MLHFRTTPFVGPPMPVSVFLDRHEAEFAVDTFKSLRALSDMLLHPKPVGHLPSDVLVNLRPSQGKSNLVYELLKSRPEMMPEKFYVLDFESMKFKDLADEPEEQEPDPQQEPEVPQPPKNKPYYRRNQRW